MTNTEKKKNMDNYDLKEYLLTDIAARVEDRLQLPYGSVELHDHHGMYFLRIDPILSEGQKQQLKAFLGDKLA